PRPERAWRRVAEGAVDIDEAPPRPPRPCWLLPRPIPLRDPRPRIVSGPERLESGWWDGEDARRDYYVIETSQGQRAWAFAPPGEQGHWMLQGWFSWTRSCSLPRVRGRVGVGAGGRGNTSVPEPPGGARPGAAPPRGGGGKGWRGGGFWGPRSCPLPRGGGGVGGGPGQMLASSNARLRSAPHPGLPPQAGEG